MSVGHVDISYDLIDGIYDVLNNFIFKEVDNITLSGTSGTATILNNGITKTATWHTSLTITASDFVTANTPAYLAAGTVITSSGAILTFTALTPGTGFTGATTITAATGTLAGTVASADVTYPIYKSIPKPAAVTYVFVGNVIQAEDGTKDSFIYNGTVQIHIVDESKERGDMKLAQSILNVVRGLLKPARSTVFVCGSKTLVEFTPESLSTLTGEEIGISKIRLIDMYNFIIQ
ncbi:MAG: hypothetical protein V1720_00135 [bacterium]